MYSPSSKISDQTILSLLADNHLKAWELLYEKYAAALYGIIYNLTDDSIIAEEIFIAAFLQLKEKEILSKVTHALFPCLLRHVHTFTRQQLKERRMPWQTKTAEETTLVNTLCTQQISIKELASKFKMTEQEAKNKIRFEFVGLRSKYKKDNSIYQENELSD